MDGWRYCLSACTLVVYELRIEMNWIEHFRVKEITEENE